MLKQNNIPYLLFIETQKINYLTESTNSYRIQESNYHTLNYMPIVPTLRKKSQSEIKNNIQKLTNLKILKKIESYTTYKKYLILNDDGKEIGFMYLGDSSLTVDEIRKIKYNLDYLAYTWIDPSLIDSWGYCFNIPFYILNISFKDMELLVYIFKDDSFHTLNSNVSLIKLHEYNKYFFIKNLSKEDVIMYNSKPIIINPEKVLLKDIKVMNLKQSLQFFNEGCEIKTIDKTPEEIKKEIEKLEIRQMLKIIGDNII